jgi:putative oxygen-independent coproporphyrinogen III oxidase
MMRMRDLPPLSLYIHFPWCVRKCPYCDFNSHTLHGELPQSDYIEALLRDLTQQSDWIQGRVLQSIFLGGGTPSLFSPAALSQLLEAVHGYCGLAADVEITMECNPGTIERGRFADYRAAGITRVSIGAQTFSDPHLQQLGRIHAAADTLRAAEELHAAGVTNFNLDLMYGLPQQSVEQALADIETALALRPAHLSHYQLTLEPGTVFAGRPPAGMPDADLGAAIQIACQERLAQAGFVQYEVSAYASDGRTCRHNLNYWTFGDYLGVGAGAHGKSTRRSDDSLQVERSTCTREPRRYLAGIGTDAAALQRRPVPVTDLPFEYMLNALRLNAGFESREFEQRTGLPFESLQQPLQRAMGLGLMERDAQRWRASARGFNFLNDLQEIFLPQLSENMTGVRGTAPTPADAGS